MAMNNTFIDPEKIDILCGSFSSYDNNTKESCYETDEDAKKESVSQESGWKKIASKVKKNWGKIKPVISGLITAFSVATALVKAVSKFCTQCKNMKEAFA